jgi:hypothetical protein
MHRRSGLVPILVLDIEYDAIRQLQNGGGVRPITNRTGLTRRAAAALSRCAF